MSSDSDKAAKSITVDGKPPCTKDSNFKTSTGDEAGSIGGIASNKTKGKAEFVMGSMDVKFEGKCAVRTFDTMLHNDKNTPPFPLLQAPVVALPKSGDDPKCPCCGEDIF
jgi:hypothetical protein